jgi:hypothetical protein
VRGYPEGGSEGCCSLYDDENWDKQAKANIPDLVYDDEVFAVPLMQKPIRLVKPQGERCEWSFMDGCGRLLHWRSFAGRDRVDLYEKFAAWEDVKAAGPCSVIKTYSA